MVACLKCLILPKNEILALHECECFVCFGTKVFGFHSVSYSWVCFNSFFRFEAKFKSSWLAIELSQTQNKRHHSIIVV